MATILSKISLSLRTKMTQTDLKKILSKKLINISKTYTFSIIFLKMKRTASLNGPIKVLTWHLVSHNESVVSIETVWPMAVSQMMPMARIIGHINWMKINPNTHETKH